MPTQHYPHHCAACQFLGEDTPKTDIEKKQQRYVDIYIHRGWRNGLGTFTRRWGPGPMYSEANIADAEGPQWDVVRLAAVKKGLLLP